MTLPAGVETRTVKLTMPLDALGKPPRSYEGLVTVDRALVWEATEERLWPAGAELPNVLNGAIFMPVPRVDQGGWLDASGAAITFWTYTVSVTALWRSGERQTVERTFQVVEDTPDPVELELLPGEVLPAIQLGSGVGDEALAALWAAINAEAVARANGDTANANSIAAEVVNRAAGDQTLTTAIGDKASTAALDAEIAARVAAVTAEAAARVAADNALTVAVGGKADSVHTHVMDDVTGLAPALAGKATAAQGALADTAVQPAVMAAAFDALIDGAPGLLDTLGEIAAALEDQDDVIDGMLTSLAGKASTVDLAAEAAARGAADTALDGRVTTLENADFTTEDDLAIERDARVLADANLDTRIAAVEGDYATATDLAAEAALARNADNLTSGTIADARVAGTIARDAEVAAAVAAEAVLARNADNLTSGAVADARIPAAIARDDEVTTAIANRTHPYGHSERHPDGTQSIPNGSVLTTVLFATQDVASRDGVSYAAGVWTFANAGRYDFAAFVQLAVGGSGQRELVLLKNNAVVVDSMRTQTATAGVWKGLVSVGGIELGEGDTLRVQVAQGHTGALDCTGGYAVVDGKGPA